MAARLEGSASEEWRNHWTVVAAACAGAAMSATSSYATSLFFEPLEREYGWSRVAISSVHLFGSFFSFVLAPMVGHWLDRFGPRRIGIASIITFLFAFSMLGLTGSSIWSWRALWVVLALVSMLYQPMVWSSAVASFFTAGRGFAMAVALCGTSICSVMTPPLTVFLIDRLGWRLAFPALAGCWTLLVLPLVLLWFTSATDEARKSGRQERMGVAHIGFFSSFRGEALTPKFLQVAVAGFSIALVVVSTALSIVPILSSNGIARGTAAGIAALLGLSSIAGRLTIGMLLDRFQGRYVAALAVCMPIVGCLVLLTNPGSVPAASVAVVIFGLALGAELDILAYLTSRYFKLANFGLLFALIGGFVSLAGAIGPVLLNAVYDATHSYALALWGVIPVCMVSAVLFVLLGPYPENAR